METWRTISILIGSTLVIVYCVLPLLLFSVTAYFVTRHLRNLTVPNVEKLHREFDRIVARHPDASDADLIGRMIRRQALKAGEVGAITGLGGLLTLPITLPVDVLLSMRIQAATVQFIAERYGFEQVSERELEIRRYLIMVGGERLARQGQRLTAEFLQRFIGRSLAKFIPLLGALLGFGMNYTLARASGGIAYRWYSGQLTLPDGTGPAQLGADTDDGSRDR